MKKIKLNKMHILIGVIAIIILIVIASVLIYIRPNKVKIVPTAEERATSKLKAHEIYNEDIDISLGTLTSSKDDNSAFIVKDGAIVTLRESAVKKYDGFISDKTKLEEIGLNSAIVVSYGSQLKVTETDIETTVDYTNGIYVSGQKTKVNLIDSKIYGYGTYNNGAIVATSGYLELEHSNITTKFKYSPAIIVKDSKGKAILKNNVMLETNGSSSPLFKSSGIITMTDSTGTANGSRFAVLQGGSLTIKNSTLISAGANDNETELPSGILIKDKERETIIKISDSSLNINSKMPYYKTAIIFNAIDAKSTITLTNTQLNYGSNKVLSLTNSEVNLNCENQTIQGGFDIDEKSALNINLKHNSLLMGSINNNNTNNNITLTLDDSSKVILTEDTYIKELKNETKDNSNIKFNNHKLYVNGTAIN